MSKIVFRIPRRSKRRRYPIKRDEHGRSARQRAFEAFDHGKRPSEVARLVGVSPRTAYRYFADWKKLPKNLDLRYRMMKTIRKDSQEFSKETVESLSAYLEMSEEEVRERLEKPWGLKHLLMGKWVDLRQEREAGEAEARLQAALALINLIESAGVSPEQILKHLLALEADSRVPVVPPES